MFTSIFRAVAALARPRAPQLLVDGKPFRFIGANTINFFHYREHGLSIEDTIRTAKENGIRVIRIYLDDAGCDRLPVADQTLDFAAKHGVMVIATLMDCCCAGSKDYFKHRPKCMIADDAQLEAFKKRIEEILHHKNTVNGRIYREDRTILAWDLANELPLHLFSDSRFNFWLEEVSSHVKSLDPHRLLTIGIDAASDRWEEDGPHFDAINVSDLDFFSLHYNLPNHRGPLSSHLKAIRARIKKFRALGKPVVLEEFGTGSQRQLEDKDKLDPRALPNWLQGYKDQMDAAFSAGAAGVMFWGWGASEGSRLPHWWSVEDHHAGEVEFARLIREYRIPP
jgi:endo-1,4-beta-mannosidase